MSVSSCADAVIHIWCLHWTVGFGPNSECHHWKTIIVGKWGCYSDGIWIATSFIMDLTHWKIGQPVGKCWYFPCTNTALVLSLVLCSIYHTLPCQRRNDCVLCLHIWYLKQNVICTYLTHTYDTSMQKITTVWCLLTLVPTIARAKRNVWPC